ncbi:uncharacterized protein LOC123318929 [Coccinella septempunctata]|uniref:uncharacterized protein LOC123318929 n=1 Tax=Coccinella septempunctata TaxID=41139 RepID=UPI001D05F179|nr:uncharacterized protein LOC123318929 [Coccinella septempunctata]
MEKWMIPCGHAGSSKNSNQIDLIQTIIDQSKRSLVMIDTLKDKFAIKTFGSNWTDVQEFQGSIQPLSWFPKIEKELGKPLSKEELDKIELNTLLKDSYKNLQIIAVAVDQMISDEEKRRGTLIEDYRKTIELYVLSVLCEIQTASNTLNVARHKDVERTIIDPKDKNGDDTTMMTRHYLIIRDYLRLLEYIIECYEHVKSKL